MGSAVKLAAEVRLADSDQGIHAVKRFGRTVLRNRMVAKFDAQGANMVPLQQCIDEEIRILGRRLGERGRVSTVQCCSEKERWIRSD
eukprot:Skav221039  [mRNA]  locus=scaffold1448:165783:166942:+ [translate_table: standard]